jgi:sortase B
MPENSEKKTKKVLSKKGKIAIDILLTVSLCVAAFSGYKLVSGLIGYKQADEKYDTLKSEAKETAPTSQTVSNASSIDWNYLASQNANVAAWITLPDSVIDYPVTYSDDNSYYLDHLFDGTSNYAGCVFVDYRNARGFTDKNTVFYAHYMYNGEGRMFTALNNYTDQSYYDTHKVFTIDTPTALYQMKVVAGIETTGTSDYIHLTFGSNDEFLNYVNSFVENSTFQSDATIGANDQMITLSTCSPKNPDGRYALIGKLEKIKDYDK